MITIGKALVLLLVLVLGVGSVPMLFEGLAVLVFALAPRRLRLRRRRESIRVTGVDPQARVWVGIVLALALPFSLVFNRNAAFCFAAVALTVWLGLRLEVQVTADRTRLIRRFAFVVPWWWTTGPDAPRLDEDGWGDLSNPLSLRIMLGSAGPHLELAWVTRGNTARLDAFAAELAEAVADVRGAAMRQ